ncbi:MAG: molybdopterin molybdenumtransferase MoeA, partial [Candidatus Bathyarchaeia archaeon]
PIIERMLGLSASLPLRVVKARCLRRLPSSLGNRTFARVIVRKMDEGFVFEPLSTSGSGIISTLVKANGIVTIPENKEGVEEGELVEVRIIRPIEGLTT